MIYCSLFSLAPPSSLVHSLSFTPPVSLSLYCSRGNCSHSAICLHLGIWIVSGFLSLRPLSLIAVTSAWQCVIIRPRRGRCCCEINYILRSTSRPIARRRARGRVPRKATNRNANNRFPAMKWEGNWSENQLDEGRPHMAAITSGHPVVQSNASAHVKSLQVVL